MRARKDCADGLSIFYLINNASFFVSHRLHIALKARECGYNITLAVGKAGSLTMEQFAIAKLKNFNLHYNRLLFESAGLNLIFEITGFMQLFFLLKKQKPDLIHCASPKAVIYGGLAARLARVNSLVLAISGMGFVFTESRKSRWLRKFIAAAYKNILLYVLAHKNIRVIVQNKDDYAAILSTKRVDETQINLIKGSGVELENFINFPIEEKQSIVVLPARLVADKGILEFVEAVKNLKASFPNWRFILAGAADYKNPTAISLDLINSWHESGLLEWLGHVEHIAQLLGKASIVCLPSYREGMPKVLLEAAAAGCAIVTTDVVGCRDSILPGETGDLVPVQNSLALTESLRSLIIDRRRREKYGRKGRQFAIRNYSVQNVVDRTLNIYQELIKNAK